MRVSPMGSTSSIVPLSKGVHATSFPKIASLWTPFV